MPKIDLLPCPFCGAKGKVTISSKKTNVWRNGIGDAVYYRVYSSRCNCCNARGPAVGGLCGQTEQTVVMYGKETQVHSYNYYHDKAAEAWNVRASGWIPCSERMPENAKPCAVLTEDRGMGVSRNYGRNRLEWTLFGKIVTHWMPLQEPPEIENNME